MKITVGILSALQISIRFKDRFREKTSSILYTGEVVIVKQGNSIVLKNERTTREVTLPLHFEPLSYEKAEFELAQVRIGIDFHWERTETQCFRGSLHIISENDKLTAVNKLDIEDYLLSVISSEMKATSSLEFLKAHAVISRSWVLAQQEKRFHLTQHTQPYQSEHRSDEEYIRWFDREDHLHFDVCADDHCQRYQGIQRVATSFVKKAVRETAGEVLCYNEEICDARFSKCCGGISEKFENVWEDRPVPYLKQVYDRIPSLQIPDLSQEQSVKAWVESRPEAFCHTEDRHILSQVLNDYDQETKDFFRWEVYYTQEELSQLVQKKLALNLGMITDLIPIERGTSGRLIRLKICGQEKEIVLGKELMIRKALSPTHLYSSAFIVEKEKEAGHIKGFRLKGAGWGHGVGLCQIGAAVMGAKGFSYREILNHYFPGSSLRKKY